MYKVLDMEFAIGLSSLSEVGYLGVVEGLLGRIFARSQIGLELSSVDLDGGPPRSKGGNGVDYQWTGQDES